MLNWLKANRKKMNAGELKPERVLKFKELLALMEEYKRKNLYVWLVKSEGKNVLKKNNNT